MLDDRSSEAPDAAPTPPALSLRDRVLLGALGLLALGGLAWFFRGVFTPLFLAFFIAYMLDPLVDRFEARGIHRGAGIAILLTGTLAVLTLGLILVVPKAVHDAGEFLTELPRTLERWTAALAPALERIGVQLPRSLDEALRTWDVDPRQMASSAWSPVSGALAWIAGGTVSAFGAIAGAMMVPVFAFYLLYDFDRIVAAVGELVPHPRRPLVYGVAREIDDVLGHWVRGQFTVMAALGVLYAIGFSLAGAPLAIPIGLFAGLISFIPYVGGAVGVGLALLTCAVDGKLWPEMGFVVIAFGVVQVLDGFVITPKIVGDKVGLGALVVLVALMMGNQLFGFLGVLMAVPGAAVAKIFLLRALAVYRASEAFGAPDEISEAAATQTEATGGEPEEPEPGPELMEASNTALEIVLPPPDDPDDDRKGRPDATERQSDAHSDELE